MTRIKRSSGSRAPHAQIRSDNLVLETVFSTCVHHGNEALNCSRNIRVKYADAQITWRTGPRKSPNRPVQRIGFFMKRKGDEFRPRLPRFSRSAKNHV